MGRKEQNRVTLATTHAAREIRRLIPYGVQPASVQPRGDRTTALLSVATLVATVATAGSLWFSLGLGLVPCTLCWYQRILMYPLVVVLGVATFDRRPGVVRTVLPLAVPGLGIAAYHSFLQATTSRCTLGGPCAAVQWQSPVVGLTIPNLSLVAFGLITVLCLVIWRSNRAE